MKAKCARFKILFVKHKLSGFFPYKLYTFYSSSIQRNNLLFLCVAYLLTISIFKKLSQIIVAPLKFVIYTDSNKIINKEKIDIVASTNWCTFTVNFNNSESRCDI